MGLPLVVIDDLHVVSICSFPAETDAPLVVDPDAVLSGPISPQNLQPVAGRNPQILKRLCPVQHEELSEGSPVQVVGQSPNRFAVKQGLGFAGSE
jgi:hypothetical protein